ncbi:anhydro-N-acetylmuramic acid kinase [Egibacter rhizosphaerae]|uniref:Anhydro-N-acetylmuramic acid kinase n=1 Tax=Egibacter rhizosphaerae TaxID=1670831 RepID=A0A411YDC1_9ACTN|nr:anhydro-N-acetylmuramic acid kinase [Egibacter rhizosphaerae]QBI19147.1 anhydro-N-acetylmuramic acid kinase [Egibacter rhizosphaerae]
MIVLGLISGTSADGIDVAAADLELRDDELVLRPLGCLEVAYPPEVQGEVDALLPPTDAGPDAVCRVDAALGDAFGAAADEANAALAGGQAALVASHGQTVFHWVEDGQARGTLQLGQPARIAHATGLPTIADLRNRDIAAGGHGAPLAAYPDVLLLAGLAEDDAAAGGDEGEPASPTASSQALLNIGGIANLTLRRADGSALAFDSGPGNALIDASVAELTGGRERFDAGGRRGRRGQVHPRLLDVLLDDPYYAAPPPKSTGKEHFHQDYLADRLAVADLEAPTPSRAGDTRGSIEGDDLVATLTALTAETIARAARAHGVGELIASGGGTRNPTLMEELAARAPGVAVRTIDRLGIPSDGKEAYWFAVLGFLSLHNLPGALPSCTGATHASVLGHLSPGANGFPRIRPVERTPRRLRVEAAPSR